MLPQAHHARRNPDQSCRCSKKYGIFRTGQQNTPAALSALLALNLLCGLYFKEASSHEEI